MAHGEAEHGCARGEQPLFRGDQDEQSTSFTGKPLRWVCGAVPAGAEVAPAATGSGVSGSGGSGSGSTGVGPALTGIAAVGPIGTAAVGPIGVGPGGVVPGGPGGTTGAEPAAEDGVVEVVVVGALVPRQRTGEPAGTSTTANPTTNEADPADPIDQADGELHRAPSCQPDGPGWAGGHRHGAVRPGYAATAASDRRTDGAEMTKRRARSAGAAHYTSGSVSGCVGGPAARCRPGRS